MRYRWLNYVVIFMLPATILVLAGVGVKWLRPVFGWLPVMQPLTAFDLLFAGVCALFVAFFTTRLLTRRDAQTRSAELQLRESESRFGLLVGSVKDYAIFMLDPVGRIVTWNDGAERIKGYTPEEIIGRHISVFYTPLEIGRGEPQYNLSQAEKYGRFEQEGERVRKDGSIFWANIIFTALRGPEGNLLGFAKVTRDISERRRSEEQITYLARLMEDASDAMFSTDASFVVRAWNKAAELLYGYSLAEVRGKSAREILRTRMDEDTITGIRDKLIRDRYWKGEVCYLTKSGAALTILLSASMVRNSEGEADGFVMVCRDFTERKKLELQLEQFNRELEAQVKLKTAELTGTLDRITDAFMALDRNLCYTFVNKRGGQLLRKDPAFLIGKYVWDVFPDAIGSGTWHAFKTAMAEQRYLTNTDYYAPFDLWHENHLYPSADGLSVFVRDVTENIKSEKEITDYKYALDQSSIVSLTDERGVIKHVNENFCRVSGYAPGELIGHTHRSVSTGHHPVPFFQKMWETISKGEVWKGEVRNRAKDGSDYWLDMTIIPFLNAKSEPYEYIALGSDITERKNAAEMLSQSYQDVRQLASHLQDVREEERADIAREIHDELGQQLTGLKMDLSWMGKKKALQEDDDLRQQSHTIMNLLDKMIMTVRKIATDLHPSILDDFGLVPAIEWQCQEFERRSGIRVVFTTTIPDRYYPPATAIGLFRICQESLTNIARHASASLIRIALREETGGYVLLAIEDDGRGFAVRTTDSKKTLGLLGMKERAMMMGGEFRIESEPGQGTKIFVSARVTP